MGINYHSVASASSYTGGYMGFYGPVNYSGDQADGGPIPPSVGGEVKASTSDTLTAYFAWIGPNPVPDHADFLLQTQVSASAATSYGQPNPSSGLSATATATLGSDTKTVSASAPGDNHTANLPGNHLIRVGPSGKIVTITRSAKASTDTSNSVPFGLWQQWQGSYYYYSGDPANGYQNDNSTATAGAYASGTARPDSREVTITSGIETSYYKGAYDAQHGTDRYIHQRNADGSIAVDSVLVWHDASSGVGGVTIAGWQVNDMMFHANASNFVNSSYAWSLQGSGTYDNYANGPTAYLNLRETDGSRLPEHSTLTVNVSDSDGAVAANTYDVTWHLPYEANQYLGFKLTKHAIDTRIHYRTQNRC